MPVMGLTIDVYEVPVLAQNDIPDIPDPIPKLDIPDVVE
jgi:hypothetical protein